MNGKRQNREGSRVCKEGMAEESKRLNGENYRVFQIKNHELFEQPDILSFVMLYPSLLQVMVVVVVCHF